MLQPGVWGRVGSLPVKRSAADVLLAMGISAIRVGGSFASVGDKFVKSLRTLMSELALSTALSTSNMTLFDEQGRIHKWETPERVLQDFYSLPNPNPNPNQDFEHIQNQHRTRLNQFLRESWQPAIKKVPPAPPESPHISPISPHISVYLPMLAIKKVPLPLPLPPTS